MNGVHSPLTNGSINFIFQFTPTTLTGLHVWASYSGKWPLTSDCGVCSGGGGEEKGNGMNISRTHCRLYRCDAPVVL